MAGLKDLMDKYENLTTENGLMDGVEEIDMDPTVGVVEVIVNGEAEEEVKKDIESAIEDAEEVEETTKDAEELEEVIDAEEKEEATTESALRVITKVDALLTKHGFTSDEDKVAMGFDMGSINTESAQSFPVATRESALDGAKNVLAKIKAAIKVIIDKIISIFNSVKDKLLALVGNNAAAAKKLKGVIAGLEDKLAEGKEFKGDFASKFPLASAVNSTSVIASMFTADSAKINSVIKLFVDGCAAKNLDKFNSLDGIADNKEVTSLMVGKKSVLVGVNGSSVTAVVVKGDSVVIETKAAEGKAPALTAPLSNADLTKICDAIINTANASKKIIESTKASFESLKNLKVEDAEFAKTAKIQSTVSALTGAKMKMVESLSKQPKNALQFVAANLAVKAKKA